MQIKDVWIKNCNRTSRWLFEVQRVNYGINQTLYGVRYISIFCGLDANLKKRKKRIFELSGCLGLADGRTSVEDVLCTSL